MNNILPSYLNKLISQFENGERTLRSIFDNNKLSVLLCLELDARLLDTVGQTLGILYLLLFVLLKL